MEVYNILLDSNFIISYINEKDINHGLAVDTWKDILNSKISSANIYISSVSVYEVMVVLTQLGKTEEEIKDIYFQLGVLFKVITFGDISCFRHIRNFLISDKETLRTNDFIISSIAIDLNAKLVTFDTKMINKIQEFYPNLIYKNI